MDAVPEQWFDRILAKHAEDYDTVFVHAGLSDIKRAFETNPYEFLLKRLDDYFESILAPGFTESFKETRVYHRTYSKPSHGMFNRLFLDDADYRTRDAIKSILVRGPYRFDGCRHDHTYHENGCFNQLVEDDVLVLNVGVPWLKCSHFHYLESRYEVDYMETREYDGIIYLDEADHESVTQTTGVYTSQYFSWNRLKIQRDLEEEGALESYSQNGLRVMVFGLRDVTDALGERLTENERYLVSL